MQTVPPPAEPRISVVSLKLTGGESARLEAWRKSVAPEVPLATFARVRLLAAMGTGASPGPSPAVDREFLLRVALFVVTQVRPDVPRGELHDDLNDYFGGGGADGPEGGAP